MAVNHEEFAADVIALRAVVHALIKTHPYPALVLEAFQKEREVFNAMSLGSRATDKQVALIDRKLAAFDLTLQAVAIDKRSAG